MKTYKMYSEETKQIEDFSVVELLRIAASNQYRMAKRNDDIDERRNRLIYELEIVFNNAGAPLNIASTNEDKPSKGASYSVTELSDRFRINYRCGYSRNNYAPVIEVLKQPYLA